MKKIILLILSIGFFGSAMAAVPADSEYKKDSQSTYNKDATNDIFNFANNVACYIKAMAPEQMIQRGTDPYLARIDANKCEESSQVSSGSSDTTASARYQDAWVIPAIDSNGALTAKVYIAGANSDGNTEYIQVFARIINGVAEAPPNGQWRVDFCSSNTLPSTSGLGPCDNGLGFANVDTAKVTVFQRGGRNSGGSGSGLINFTATKTGSGITRSTDSRSSDFQDVRIAFNQSRYLIASSNNGGQETNACFDPSRDNPGTMFSVWNNYFYDTTTGKKIGNGNQGFPIGTESRSGNSGFASYNGVNFWSEVPLSDQQPGKKITGNGKTYTLGVTNGYLEKVTKTTTTLADLDGPDIKLYFNGSSVNGRTPTENVYFEITRLENGAGRTLAANTWVSFVAHWNNSTSAFDISAYQICGNNCNVTPLSTTRSFSLATLIGASYRANNFGGWQDGTGINYWGSLTNASGNAVTSSAPVNREINRRVSPDDSSLTRLSCVDWNCPFLDGSGIQQMNRPTSYPFQASDIKTFSWDATVGIPKYVRGDTAGTGGAVISTPVYAFKNSDPSDTSTYEVRLYPTASLNALKCTNNTSRYCSPGDFNSTYTGEYYRWKTGSPYTKNVYLKDDSNSGQIVSFDPPLSFTYTVPSNPPIGADSRFAGKKLLLQSPGQGQIWFPSHCVSMATGKNIDCNSNDPSKEWITDVYIPTVEGADGIVTLVNANGDETSTKYLVKWTNRGAVLATAGSCPGLTLPVNNGTALPTISDWQDPTNSSSPNYLGTTWVTPPNGTTPRVIHGVVQ